MTAPANQSDGKALDVEELLQRVRSETERRRGAVPGPEPESDEPSRLALADARLPALRLQPAFTPNAERRYHVRDFLRFHDRDFVTSAYLGLLGRSPDTDGLGFHLDNLRSGTLSKVRLLGRLRLSAEGRAYGARVRGLGLRFAFESLGQVPVLGYLVRLLLSIATLPRQRVQARQRDVYAMAQLHHMQEFLNDVFEKVEAQLNRTLDALRVLERVKADAGPIARLADLDTRAELLATEITENEDRVDRLEELVGQVRDQTKEIDQRGAAAEERGTAAEAQLAGEVARLAEGLAPLAALVEQSDAMSRRADELRSGIDDHWRQIEELRSGIEDRGRQVEELQGPFASDLRGRIDALTEELHAHARRLDLSLAPHERARDVRGAGPLATSLDALFAALEDRMRGTEAEIRERSRVYLPIVTETRAGTPEHPVLDIGVGRGEWLELLRDEGLVGEGVDTNDVLVQKCLARGLVVRTADGIEHLRDVPAGRLGAITAIHVVEHLPLESLVELLDESHRTLMPGGAIVFETPNAYNLWTAAVDFWRDPTHRSPVHPETLTMLVEARGFVRVAVYGLEHDGDERRIEPLVPPPAGGGDAPRSGPRDMVLIAFKP